MMSESRGQWTHQWGFVLAACGAAVGLGNIWKFPYMAGNNGGGAFVVLYLLAVLLVGLPIMASEILIGRRAQTNPIDALGHLAQEAQSSRRWTMLGWWGMFGLVLTLSFYSVVAGWSLFYLYSSLAGALSDLSNEGLVGYWVAFLSSPTQQLLFHGLFMFMTLVVVAKGVQRGLERASVFLMPVLFLVLIFLVAYAAFSTGPYFEMALGFLFTPDFSKVTPLVVINAVGHAFFTMAIGVGAMSIYGSYLPRRISISRSIGITAVLDVLVAMLTGLAIFPIIFAHQLPADSGPGLMFLTLPMAFGDMEGGRWLGTLFFLLLLFAAWTSSINISEPLVASLREKRGMSRGKACVVVGAIAWSMGILSALSFNVFKEVHVFGRTPFEFITDLVTNVILPVGGIGYCLFTGWVMSKAVTREELTMPEMLYKVWCILTRYFAPTALIIVFISNLI